MAPSAIRGAIAGSGPLAPVRDYRSEGQHYEGHVQVFWQGLAHGPVKVIGSIDDGGWRTFVPLTTDFTMTPDGTVLSQ